MSHVKYVWMDGEIIEWNKALIHIMTPALHYGVAVFEGIRAYFNGDEWIIFRLRDHVKRLFYSAKVYRLKVNYSAEEIEKAIIDLIKLNKIKSHIYIRPIIFRGITRRKLSLHAAIAAPAQIAIALRIVESKLDNIEEFEKYRKYKIVSWRRPTPDSLPIYVKCAANYANSALAMIEAYEAGYNGAIMMDHRGFISESTGANIFIVKDGKLVTPPLYASILAGITRDTIIKISGDLGVEVEVRDFNRTELYSADEVFLCGTMAELTPISEIDGIIYNEGKPGPVTRKIAQYYYNVVNGKVTEYVHWLTKVAI